MYILIIHEEGWTGYFDPAHQMSDSLVWATWYKHSNQKEIIYLSENAFTYGPESILAHELGHMLHWGRDHSPEPPSDPEIYWEESWIDEGFATFAQVYLMEDINQQDIYDSQAFFMYDPDMSLINFSDYNLVKLWMTFMWEHFGAENFIGTLINEQANGIEGVVKTLSTLGYIESFDESFEQWIISNFLDNKSYLGGKYGYFHYNFSPCMIAAHYNQYPTGVKTGSVSSYANDYILFSSSAPGQINIYFNGTDSSKFRLSFLKLGNSTSQIYSVETLLPDSNNDATFHFDSLGADVKRIVMVVMNTDTSINEEEKVMYTYNAETVLGIEDDPGTGLGFRLFQNYPNPFNNTTVIRYSVPELSFVKVKIFDIIGNEVSVPVCEEKSPGMYELTWTAVNLPSGIYLCRFNAGSYFDTEKMILIK